MAIKHKRKNSAGYTWQTGDLVEGQIGLNIADGTLHFDKADGSTVTIAAGGATIDDSATSLTSTWSSTKIDGILGDIATALAEIQGA